MRCTISQLGTGTKMTDETRYVLGDDLPKQNPWQEDRLGYASFARRISKVIINLAAPNGYVIGLHGQWGSGKSTVLNFILAYLHKHNVENEDNQIIHIDFRPWIVSGHHDLIAAFFKVLSENLGPKDSRWTRFWKRTFRYVHNTTDSLVDAAATVALTIDPSGGVASGFAGSLTKKSVSTAIDRFLSDPSLQKAYEDLKEQLDLRGKRFLVTIDDIDRLEDKDVRSIMQMVKSIGRLPNVVYLLAYDREIVWQALDQNVERAGPRFAEKIVQQEIELPKPTKNALLKILDQNISFLPGSSSDSSRWQYILRDGIHRWIRFPRDVVRLSNAVRFSWPALEGEIDARDLLTIEGMRLFDEGAFNWIFENRDFLFTQGRFVLAQDDVRKAAVEDLRVRIPENLQPRVLNLVSVLFPMSAKWIEGRQFGGETFAATSRRRGIGSEAGYDAYFGMSPSSDAIPRAQINELVARLDDTNNIETIIRSYLGKRNSRGEWMVLKLLEELRIEFAASPPAQPTQALLDALFRVGEAIISIDWDGDMFLLSPRAEIGFLVRDILGQWNMEEAGQHLVEAFEKGASPAFLADIYVDRGRELGIFESDSSQSPLITESDFTKLGEILIKKIQAAADDGTLKQAPFFFDIVRSWAQIDSAEPAKAWLTAGTIESAEFMAKVGIGLVSHSIGTAERHYTMRDAPKSEFYDLKILVDAGQKHLQRADLTQEERALIKEIVRGSIQLLQGRSSENTKDEA